MTNLNIFQAAFALRYESGHTDLTLDAADTLDVNIYFICHDALHYYLGAKPELEDEWIVLGAELLLAGKESHSHTQEQMIEISKRCERIPSDQLNILCDIYYNHFNY